VTPDNNGPVITLTTDFGYGSPYVAAMKGVILSINPAARILDLSHAIPPQALRHAAFFLASAVPYFPPQAIHAVVVDPGVGTDRALLYVETGQHRLLVPDNGCWTELLHISGGEPLVHQITESRYWRATVSSTFHGRDILAPVAAHLSRGLDPRALGSRASKWVRLDLPRPWRGEDGLHGEVIFVDHFGNLITNIGGETLDAVSASPQLEIGDVVVKRWVRTYGEAPAGALVALVSSAGQVEIALAQGNAARELGAKIGTPVRLAGGHPGQ